jgi:hypothetical protein
LPSTKNKSKIFLIAQVLSCKKKNQQIHPLREDYLLGAANDVEKKIRMLVVET